MLVLTLAFGPGCSHEDDKRGSASETESEGERQAKAIRETFRLVLADFHADVVAGRLDSAYARLAPMYRAGVTLARFSSVAKHPFFTDGVTFAIRETSATAGTAKVSALMKGPNGTSQVEMRCTAIDGTWKIAGISLDGAPVLPAP
jgi:hypothetical protein